MLTLKNPQQQSGQEHIRSTYKSVKEPRRKCDTITVVWLPSDEDNDLWTRAKEEAKEPREWAKNLKHKPLEQDQQHSAWHAPNCQEPARQSGKALQEGRHDTAGQTHSTAIRLMHMERSHRALPTENRDSTGGLLPIPYQSRTIRYV